jgi:broad specificity phosphatase PhoE
MFVDKSSHFVMYHYLFLYCISCIINGRYPGVGGESYVDLISRLRSIIIEFERKKRDVLVICNLVR